MLLEAHAKKEAKHYVGKVSDPYVSLSFVVIVVYSVSRWELAFDKVWGITVIELYAEFWKHIPPNEPFRVLLEDMHDKLYNTQERMRQMLANGKSDINLEDTFTDASQILEPWSSAIGRCVRRETSPLLTAVF